MSATGLHVIDQSGHDLGSLSWILDRCLDFARRASRNRNQHRLNLDKRCGARRLAYPRPCCFRKNKSVASVSMPGAAIAGVAEAAPTNRTPPTGIMRLVDNSECGNSGYACVSCGFRLSTGRCQKCGGRGLPHAQGRVNIALIDYTVPSRPPGQLASVIQTRRKVPPLSIGGVDKLPDAFNLAAPSGLRAGGGIEDDFGISRTGLSEPPIQGARVVTSDRAATSRARLGRAARESR